jgi:hypothetical protein
MEDCAQTSGRLEDFHAKSSGYVCAGGSLMQEKKSDAGPLFFSAMR